MFLLILIGKKERNRHEFHGKMGEMTQVFHLLLCHKCLIGKVWHFLGQTNVFFWLLLPRVECCCSYHHEWKLQFSRVCLAKEETHNCCWIFLDCPVIDPWIKSTRGANIFSSSYFSAYCSQMKRNRAKMTIYERAWTKMDKIGQKNGQNTDR